MSKLYNVLLKLKNAIPTQTSQLTNNSGFITSSALSDYINKSTITFKEASGSSKSIATGTYTNLCSISLAAGTWMVHGTAQSGGASSGDLHVIINTAAAWNANHMQKIKLGTGGNVVSAVAILTLTSAATYYLVAMQNSGSSLTISRSHLEAVRLKDQSNSSSSGSSSGDDSTSGITTNDYSLLSNKPSIENITLDGNKTFEDFNLTEVDDNTVLAAFNSVFGS